MLEIIALVLLTRALVREAQLRGRSGGWAALGPVLWIAAEIAALTFASVAGFDSVEMMAIGFVAGALGGALAYLVVSSLRTTEWATDPSLDQS